MGSHAQLFAENLAQMVVAVGQGVQESIQFVIGIGIVLHNAPLNLFRYFVFRMGGLIGRNGFGNQIAVGGKQQGAPFLIAVVVVIAVGDVVYRAGIPAVELLPGNRYTYLVKISSTQIELTLTIADWNERDSSYEIDFNK